MSNHDKPFTDTQIDTMQLLTSTYKLNGLYDELKTMIDNKSMSKDELKRIKTAALKLMRPFGVATDAFPDLKQKTKSCEDIMSFISHESILAKQYDIGDMKKAMEKLDSIAALMHELEGNKEEQEQMNKEILSLKDRIQALEAECKQLEQDLFKIF